MGFRVCVEAFGAVFWAVGRASHVLSDVVGAGLLPPLASHPALPGPGPAMGWFASGVGEMIGWRNEECNGI